MSVKSSYATFIPRRGVSRRIGLRRRLFRGLLICVLIWTALDVLYIHHLVSSSSYRTNDITRPSLVSERLFIASTHWNNEAILRSHWNDAIIELAKAFGPDNIFVSIFESGSWDDTKGALRDLDANLDRLGVRRNITLSNTTHEDEISASPGEGWIDTPRHKKELRRISYLARLRNWSLRPLEDLSRRGITFDKVLFLNDVVFTVCFTGCVSCRKIRLIDSSIYLGR